MGNLSWSINKGKLKLIQNLKLKIEFDLRFSTPIITMKFSSYLRVDSSRQFFCKMVKWHSLKMPWLTNDQTSLDLRIKWSFRGGKNKSCFRHFESSWREKMPAETLSLVMQAQRWSTLPLQSGILPLVQRRKSKSLKANSLEWLKRKHFYSEICSIVWFSLSRKITNPALTRAQDPVRGQRKC